MFNNTKKKYCGQGCKNSDIEIIKPRLGIYFFL